MSILGTNCRDLGGAAIVCELREAVKRHSPSIMCVVETQLHKNSVEKLSRSLGFDKGFAISCSSRSDGIGLFWNNDFHKHRSAPLILPMIDNVKLSNISGTKAYATLVGPFALFPAHHYHYDGIQRHIEAPTDLTYHAATTLVEDS